MSPWLGRGERIDEVKSDTSRSGSLSLIDGLHESFTYFSNLGVVRGLSSACQMRRVPHTWGKTMCGTRTGLGFVRHFPRMWRIGYTSDPQVKLNAKQGNEG